MLNIHQNVFSVKVLLACSQFFYSKTIYKFKIKLIYNEEKIICTKIELLNFKIILTSAKLDMAGLRLLSNCLIFSDDASVNIQLKTFLLLSNYTELSIREKTNKFW